MRRICNYVQHRLGHYSYYSSKNNINRRLSRVRSALHTFEHSCISQSIFIYISKSYVGNSNTTLKHKSLARGRTRYA